MAILAIFCIVATEVFKRHPELHPRKKVIAGALAGGGALLWLIGKVHGGSDEGKTADRIFTMRFCGSMLAACAGIVSNITPIQQAMQSPASILNMAKRANARDAGPASERKGESSRPSFFRRASAKASGGPLRVQGIIFQRKAPSAIINGKTVFVGDRVGEARVVAIDRNAVTVEVERQTCVLAFQ